MAYHRLTTQWPHPSLLVTPPGMTTQPREHLWDGPIPETLSPRDCTWTNRLQRKYKEPKNNCAFWQLEQLGTVRYKRPQTDCHFFFFFPIFNLYFYYLTVSRNRVFNTKYKLSFFLNSSTRFQWIFNIHYLCKFHVIISGYQRFPMCDFYTFAQSFI